MPAGIRQFKDDAAINCLAAVRGRSKQIATLVQQQQRVRPGQSTVRTVRAATRTEIVEHALLPVICAGFRYELNDRSVIVRASHLCRQIERRNAVIGQTLRRPLVRERDRRLCSIRACSICAKRMQDLERPTRLVGVRGQFVDDAMSIMIWLVIFETAPECRSDQIARGVDDRRCDRGAAVRALFLLTELVERVALPVIVPVFDQFKDSSKHRGAALEGGSVEIARRVAGEAAVEIAAVQA